MQLKHKINGRVSDYWDIHKEVWENEFNNLDAGIARGIMHDPRGEDALEFERKIDKLVQTRVESNNY